jgi:U6 snRNA-associated Sm-like protein LSm7
VVLILCVGDSVSSLVTGTLKGYDPLLNLVLDDTKEFIRDAFDPYKLTAATRTLGLTVARGTAVMMVCPVDGTMEIANPFLQQEEEQGGGAII